MFRLDLDLPEEVLDRMMGWLSPEERSRAARYRSPSDQKRFIASHGQVRQVLAGILGVEPGQVSFQQNAYGKPGLMNAPKLGFNLSHSHQVGLLAVCSGCQVGVDIEYIHKTIEIEAIARRFFAPGETAALAALPQEHQQWAFFSCWTRKEAYIKARGAGLSIALDRFEVSLAPGEPPQLFDRLPDRTPSEIWSLYELDPGRDYCAALAVEGRDARIYCWEWPVRKV